MFSQMREALCVMAVEDSREKKKGIRHICRETFATSQLEKPRNAFRFQSRRRNGAVEASPVLRTQYVKGSGNDVSCNAAH